MTKSSIALGSVLALVALLALWIVTSDGPASSASAEPGITESAAMAQPEELPVRLAQPASGERMLVEEQPGAETGANGTTLSAALTEGRAVRVISALSGEPLPGALVTWFGVTQERRGADYGPEHYRGQPLDSYLELDDPEEGLRDDGVTYVADENGQLFLPARDGVVMGRHENLWLMREVYEDPSQGLVLALEQDSSVTLRVVDAQGFPVGGMEVFLCKRSGVWPEDMFYGRTEAETGECRFPHLGAQLRAMQAGLFGDLDANSEVFFCAITQAPELVKLDLNMKRLPVGRVDLILPPAGSVVLRVVDSAGELVRDGWFRTFLFETGVDEQVFPGDYINGLSDSQAVEGQGSVRFDRIGVGMEFSMELVLIGGAGSYESTFLGPRFDGEEVLVSIEVDPLPPSVSLRVVDVNGAPMAQGTYFETTVNLRRGPDAYKHTQGLRTDASGRIHMHGLDGNSLELGDTCEFTLVQRHLRPMRTGRATTALPLVLGLNDLGDVTIDLASTIARGRVVDRNGAPVSGGHVSARAFTPASAGVGASLGGKVSGAGTRTDASGAFVLRGLHDGEQLSLTCSKLGFLASRLDGVGVGAEDVVVQMDLAGYLAGSVLVAEGGPPDRVEIVVRAPDAVPAKDDPFGRKLGRKTSPDRAGAFRSKGLTPGEYTVVVFLEGVAEPLLQVDEVRVSAGETTFDARLEEIDLRFLHVFEIEITDHLGIPIEEGWVGVREATQEEDAYPSNWFSESHFRVVVPYDAVDLKVEAGRFRTQLVRGVIGDTRVMLDPWPSVLLALDDSSVTFDGSLTVELWMETPEGEGEYESADWSDQLDENGEGLWYLDRPGTWAIHLQAFCPEGYWGDLEPIEIEVADIPEEQRIEIHLAPEALEAALAECAEGEDD